LGAAIDAALALELVRMRCWWHPAMAVAKQRRAQMGKAFVLLLKQGEIAYECRFRRKTPCKAQADAVH